jgi:hypothetical protein
LNRLLIELVAASLLIGGFTLYERHAGAAQCVQAVHVATAHEEGVQQAQAADDSKTIAIEAEAYAKAHQPDPDAIPAPIVRVCHYSPLAVPSARPAGLSPDAPRDDGAASAVPGPNVGPDLVQVGHVADAQIAGLQDYIVRVCRAR